MAIGVLADAYEPLSGTLTNLRRLRAAFAAARVDLVAFLGGFDVTFEGTVRLLRQIQGSVPILAVPGDRVSESGFQAAMRELGSNAVDLTLIRAVELPAVTLLGIPGYFLPYYLLAKEQGCGYVAQQVDAVAVLARQAAGPRLLLSHGPPRGQGPFAVDRAFGDANVGDPELRRLMQTADIRFGVFAHVHEAAGHATTLAGARVAEGHWSDSLLLNVGCVDSVPHETLAGGWSGATGAIVEIADGRARYRIVRLPTRR